MCVVDKGQGVLVVGAFVGIGRWSSSLLGMGFFLQERNLQAFSITTSRYVEHFSTSLSLSALDFLS